jgi:hypothetical protein
MFSGMGEVCTYKVLSACQAIRKLEFMHEVVRLHHIACPLSVGKVQFVDLEPPITDASICNSVFDGFEKVGDGTGVHEGGPLDLDGVASLGFDCRDSRCALDGDVTGHVVALDICYGRVVWCLPNADVEAGRLVVDPYLLQDLVGRGSGDQSSRKERLGEHLEVWRFVCGCSVCTVSVKKSDTRSRRMYATNEYGNKRKSVRERLCCE